MANANINLRINAHTNVGSAVSQLRAMQTGLASAQVSVAKFNNQVSNLGRYDVAGWQQLNRNISSLQNQYNQIISMSGQWDQAQRTVTSSATDFNKALERQKVRLRDVVGNTRMLKDAYREQVAIQRMAVTSTGKDAMGNFKTNIYMPTPGEIAGIRNARQELGYFGRVLQSVSIDTVNWGKNMQWTGRQLTVGFGVPISIVSGFLAKFAIQADEGLVRIAKVYGDTEQVFAATNEAIMNMAQDTAKYIADQYGMAAQSTRDVMAELAATGMEGSELSRMTVLTQETSLLGEMSSDESLKLLRTLREVYGFNTEQLKEQRDYFNAIENATALTMQDITEGIPRIAGIMKSTGVSIQEQTELLVAFKSAGIEIAEGANALKSINFKAVAATPTAAKAFFRITGVEMQSLIDKTNGEFIPMMMEIANVMEGLEQQEKVDLVARVFGIHQGSRTITLLEQLANQSEGLLRAQAVGLKSNAELAALANKEIETIQESLSTRVKRIIEGIRASMESLGRPILEVLIPWGERLGALMNKIDGLSDGMKKLLARIALGLAVGGPLVMLLGLTGNLVGMFGRMTASLILLVAPFKVLTPLQKAAALLQEKFGTATQKTNTMIQQQIQQFNGLAYALNKVTQSWQIAMAQQKWGMTTMPGFNAALPGVQGSAVRPGYSPVNVPSQGRSSYSIIKNDRPANYVPGISNPVGDVQKVKDATQVMTAFSQATMTASVAMAGLGMITQNQTVTAIGSIGIAVSSILPALTMLPKGIGKYFGNMAKQGQWAGSAIGKAFTSGGGVATKALSALGKFVAGPWGLLIGGAVIGILALWNRHRKQMEEMRKVYEDMTDQVDQLAEAYDFTPTTPLDREREALGPDFDPNTFHGQQQRIQELKENNAEYYDALVAYAERINDRYDEATARQELLNEAIAKGATVLLQTGDPKLAQQAAWDAYRIMSGEWETFEAFTVDFQVNDMSVEQVLSDVDEAAMNAAIRFKNTFTEGLTGGLSLANFFTGRTTLDPEAIAAMKKDFSQAIENIMLIPDANARYEALEMLVGDQVEKIHEIYRRGLEEGWIEEGVTMQQFLDNWDHYFAKAGETVRSFVGNNAGLGEKMGFGVSKTEAEGLEEVLRMLESYNPQWIDDIAKYEDTPSVWSGRTADISTFMDKQREAILLEEKFQATERGDTVRVKEIDSELRLMENIARLGQRTSDIRRESAEALNTVNSNLERGRDLSIQLGMAAGDVEEGFEGAADAVAALTDEEQRYFDAHMASMDQARDDMLDELQSNFKDMQDEERKEFEDDAKTRIQDINDEHDILLEGYEADWKRRRKAQEVRFENEKDALADERKAAEKALDEANDAAMKAIDARKKALADRQKEEKRLLDLRFKGLEKAQEEAQERRRAQTEAIFDAQIAAIEAQIEKEQELEEIRQRAFDAERERISRLQQMFSSNIDLNMAVNSGDLDEAARIASEMNARSETWALDDLSAITSDASKTRQDKMREEIDAIEARKDAEMDRIREIEEAEKEALRERERLEEEALERRYDRMEDEIEAEREKQREINEIQREALSEEFEDKQKALSDRQQAQQEFLTEQIEDEREAAQTARDNAIAAEKETTEGLRVELEERLADAQKEMDRELDHARNMRVTNYIELTKLYDDVLAYARDEHYPEIEGVDKGSWDTILESREKKFRDTLEEIAGAQYLKDHAADIAKQVMEGGLGFSMSTRQFEQFIRSGVMPPEVGKNDVNRLKQVPRHSGGIIGEGAAYARWNKTTGPGAHSAKEVPVLGLEGEGVLNLRAMRTPGVPQLMQALNDGKVQSGNGGLTDMMGSGKRPGGAAGLGIQSIFPAFIRRLSEVSAITGLEVGMNKAEQMYKPINIKLSERQRQGLTDEQLANAAAIVTTGRRLGASQRDIITALMTALQESSLRNLNYGDDIYGVRNPDGSLTSSLGLFQQQKWWGTTGERLDPYKSSELFYKALFQVADRDSMPMWAAAQQVQGSAFPRAYANWEGLARILYGGAQIPDEAIVNLGASNKDRLEDIKKRYEAIKEYMDGFPYPTTGMISWLYGWRNMMASGPDFHNGLDIRAPGGTPIYAVASGTASRGWDSGGGGNYVRLDHGNGIATGYFHMRNIGVKHGERIARGQNIGTVGNTGRLSFGDHLHFSVFKGGTWNWSDPAPFMSSPPSIGKWVSPQGMRFGGLVPGTGHGDTVPRMLEPGEFVTNKLATREFLPLLHAINRGNVDFTPNLNAFEHANANARFNREVDNAGDNIYYVNVEVKGNLDKQVDADLAFQRALRATQKNQRQTRRVSR